jgi:hypothetical protein
MSRKTNTICAGTIFAGLTAIALALLPAWLQGSDNRQTPPGKLIVHEWGTFTSFSGSDGVSLEFRPLVPDLAVTSDLPRFIINSLPTLTKPESFALERMETPVTYFYTDAPRVVNVRVDFPKGMLTEYYPIVKHIETGQKSSKRPMGGAYLDWGAVRLTPPEQFAKIRVRDRKGKPIAASLPAVDAKFHYAHARETDSAIVETLDANRRSYFEKFLFYRGLGNFELPIKLAALGHDRFEITNADDDATGALLLVRIERGRVRFTRVEPVAPRAAVEIDLPAAESTAGELADATLRELVAAGLYEKEALAMVNTWRTNWFEENGTRLFYLFSSKQTDELLPLTVDPAPDEQVRVMVGRLETITPEDCARLTQALTGGNAGEQPTPDAIHAELAALGRFAEPAVEFLIGQTADPPQRARLEAILGDVRKAYQRALWTGDELISGASATPQAQ